MKSIRVIYSVYSVVETEVKGVVSEISRGVTSEGRRFVTIGYNIGSDKLAKMTIFEDKEPILFRVACVCNLDFSVHNYVWENNEKLAESIANGPLKAVYESLRTRTCYNIEVKAPKGYIFANSYRDANGNSILKHKKDVIVNKSAEEISLTQIKSAITTTSIKFPTAEKKTDKDIMLFVYDSYRTMRINSPELLTK